MREEFWEDTIDSGDGLRIWTKSLGDMNPVHYANSSVKDWSLYCINKEGQEAYSLYSMCMDIYDNQSPYTSTSFRLSFFELDKKSAVHILNQTLSDSDVQLTEEVIQIGKRPVSSKCVEYFLKTNQCGSFSFADLYIDKVLQKIPNKDLIALDIQRNKMKLLYNKRLEKILRESNCIQGNKIVIQNRAQLTSNEYNMILLSFIGNLSKYHFAAEIALHARYARSKVNMIAKHAQIVDHTGGVSQNKVQRFCEWILIGRKMKRVAEQFEKHFEIR